MARFTLPTLDDLKELGAPRENAITIYAETSPAPDARDTSYLNAKSAFDQGIRTLRETGIRHAVEESLRAQWEKVRSDEVWGRLSRSVAIFLTPDQVEMFALPNRLENQSQVGSYFDLGQIVRAVTASQSAFGLTLSANGWNLWEATATTVATELELSGEHAVDAADATNRATIRDRGHVRRLVGDEGKKVLLEQYAKRVAEAVKAELAPRDPHGERPLFLFAADPLLDLYRNVESTRRVVAVPGVHPTNCTPTASTQPSAPRCPRSMQSETMPFSIASPTACRPDWWPPTWPTSAVPPPPARCRHCSTTSPSMCWVASTPEPVRSRSMTPVTMYCPTSW